MNITVKNFEEHKDAFVTDLNDVINRINPLNSVIT